MRSLIYVVCLLAACGPGAPSGGNCPGGEVCGGSCVLTAEDESNCGGCGITCGTGESCVQGDCFFAESCVPGASEACYSGPVATLGMGPCHGGTRTCRPDGLGFDGCVGEVVPTAEVCGNTVDDNCSGVADEDVDADADGFTTCSGDCCDSTSDGCTEPTLVNPGAFDAPGNTLDDDCDGTPDNGVVAGCDVGLASSSADPMDYAKAMELCQTTTEAATDRRWGVISAQLLLPSGAGAPKAEQRSIRQAFGSTAVQAGGSLAVFSTGHAAATGQTNPAFAAFQQGVNMAQTSTVPTDWLGANGGNFPNAPGCPDPQGGTTANDPIMLKLRVRVPTNARSFSLSSNFFSSEYPEWVCSPYNDFLVVLLDSAYAGMPANPTDKNLAFYTAAGGTRYPVGVNLAPTGLFQQCKNGATGCGPGSTAGTSSMCVAQNELAGTGFDPAAGGGLLVPNCSGSDQVGGGTGWLITSGNVVGGETIELRLAMWDTGDPNFDSVVLFDNFVWSVDVAQPGTVVD